MLFQSFSIISVQNARKHEKNAKSLNNRNDQSRKRSACFVSRAFDEFRSEFSAISRPFAYDGGDVGGILKGHSVHVRHVTTDAQDHHDVSTVDINIGRPAANRPVFALSPRTHAKDGDRMGSIHVRGRAEIRAGREASVPLSGGGSFSL